MTKFTLLSVATVLSTALVVPALAQAVIQARGSYAFYHPTPPRRREEVVVSRGSANAVALPPSFRPSMPGHETATRPWSAPVGHRQPRAADVPTSASLSVLDQEDADVDRKISSVSSRGAVARVITRPQPVGIAVPPKDFRLSAISSRSRALLYASSIAHCPGGEAARQRSYPAREWSWLTSRALIGKLDAILEHVAS